MKKNIPVYQAILSGDDTDGIFAVALVESPAIERNFQAFSQAEQFVEPGQSENQDEFVSRCIGVLVGDEGYEQEQAAAVCYSKWENRNKMSAMQFSIQDADRRIISGALMLADTPIYRNDEQMGEYYLTFSADEIYKGVQKFFRNNRQSALNIEHNQDTYQQGVTMFESFIVDRKRGIMPMSGYEDVPDGSWFGSFKVDNERVWNAVKEGTFKGFSIEGILSTRPVEMSKEAALINAIKRIVNQIVT
jgi:hypothetical protein